MVLALIDDSKTDCDNLHDILVEYAAHHSNDLILHCFSSGEEFLKNYIKMEEELRKEGERLFELYFGQK